MKTRIVFIFIALTLVLSACAAPRSPRQPLLSPPLLQPLRQLRLRPCRWRNK